MKLNKKLTSALIATSISLAAPIFTMAWQKFLPPEAPEGKEKIARQGAGKSTSAPKKNNGYSRQKRQSDASAGTASYFSVPKQRFYSKGIGGHDYVTVDARNVNWRVLRYPASWVSVSEKTNDGLRLDFAENTSKEPRSTLMEIGNDSDSYLLEIYQNGSVKFEVTAIDFANTDESGEKFYSGFGEPLYSYELCYLLPRVTYNGPEKKVAKSANVRIAFPDGTYDEVMKPDEYTYQWVLNCEPGEGNTATLYTWGDNVRRRGIPYYLPGEYVFQLWVDDELAYTQPFEVKLRPTDYGAEITDYWVEHNTMRDGEQGMLVHSRVNSQNMNGYKINYCVYIADEEGNQLRDNRDRPVAVWETEDVGSDDFSWDDWTIFVPYSTIRSALRGDNQFTYKIEIQNAETFRPLSRIKGLTHSL